MVSIEIKKPLYGNFVYIRKEILNAAIRQGNQLEIIVPKGRAVVDPSLWKKSGRKMEKVFRFKDKPMILFGANVPLNEPEKKIDLQSKLF